VLRRDTSFDGAPPTDGSPRSPASGPPTATLGGGRSCGNEAHHCGGNHRHLAGDERASGQFISGNDLYAMCTSSAASVHAQCVAYVKGVIDAGAVEGMDIEQYFRTSVISHTLNGVRWCTRETIRGGQIVDVVTVFLRDNPAPRDKMAPAIVAWALRQAWPCSQ
jgi:hypothetical protein